MKENFKDWKSTATGILGLAASILMFLGVDTETVGAVQQNGGSLVVSISSIVTAVTSLVAMFKLKWGKKKAE